MSGIFAIQQMSREAAMNVYVIASSEYGPCKVGVAQNPRKRLRTLQTGNQAPLNLFHVEPAGSFARKVERAAHELLRDKRSAAGTEWFDETVEIAMMAVKSAARNMGILLSDNTQIFSDLQRKQSLEWLRQKAEFEEENDYEEDFSIQHPDLFRLLAVNYRAPSKMRSTFNDYLLSLEEGAWLRWAFERMNKRLPSGRSLARYLEADAFIESLNVPSLVRVAPREGKVAPRWIEWALGGRDLRASEIAVLFAIWNKYVTAYNRVFEGPGHDVHGESDHVDDVYVFALNGDAERGDKNMIVFSHEFFRAVLIPKRRVELVGYDKSIFGRLRPLDPIELHGFVAPPMPYDIWEKVLHSWIESARDKQEHALDAFLRNPNKRYPEIRRTESIGPASLAWRSLPSNDEFDAFEMARSY